jgi:hypothetical protein
MPTYSYKRPVRVLLDDSSKYAHEHMTHYFNTYYKAYFLSLPQEKKELMYELMTNHEEVLVKVLKGLGQSEVLLPKLLREGRFDIEEVVRYKEWLDKK